MKAEVKSKGKHFIVHTGKLSMRFSLLCCICAVLLVLINNYGMHVAYGN